MKNSLYKFVYYTRKNGIQHSTKLAVKNVRKILRKQKTAQKKIYVMAEIVDIINADFINYPYKSPSPIDKNKLKIAWVLSPISAGSGGQNTITRFIKYLQKSGHDQTVYIYEGVHPQLSSDAKRILRESFGTDVEVRPIADYVESDALIATGWETAYPVFNIQSEAHKFYFVQDFEPLFYGLGSMAVLAKNTYRFNFYGITAGKWLAHKVSSEFGMRADYFDFGVDLEIYRPDKMPTKKKKICFYARPVTERRAFELGVIALEIFYKKHPEYTIEFFGWDVSEYKIPFPYVNRGILSHEHLADLFADSTACLVLSLTNVSLLPFELLAGGCIPVMNEGDNNSMVLGKNDYIKYTGTSPNELAQGLLEVVESKGIMNNAKAASKSVVNLPWDKSYRKVEKIILREVRGR